MNIKYGHAHINKFKDTLRNRVIELIESERGLAAKMAKTINKTGSYFSDLKRGSPVNALHLKAIENYCGPEKLIEIMRSDEIECGDIHNVSPIDPAIQILDEAEKETGIKLNSKQREKVAKILREELKKKESESKENIITMMKAFKE